MGLAVFAGPIIPPYEKWPLGHMSSHIAEGSQSSVGNVGWIPAIAQNLPTA